MRFWMLVVVLHGLLVVAGVAVTVEHLLTLRPERAAVELPGTGPRRVVAA